MTTNVLVVLSIFAAGILLTTDILAAGPIWRTRKAQALYRSKIKRAQTVLIRFFEFEYCCKKIKCHKYDCILLSGKNDKLACKCYKDTSFNLQKWRNKQ